MRIVPILAAALLAALINFLFWYLPNRPTPVSEPWAGPLQSLSFAPYRRDQSPLTRTFASPTEIESDLALVAQMARGIRTYTAREGLEVVPTMAAKHGLSVTLGAWLGQDPAINDAEIAAAIAQANAHPASIKRIIVGNEVLLRRDLTAGQLIAHIRRVKQAVKQPVTYADVWEFWLKNPQIAAEVDYITVHLLPYWEDEPVDVANTIPHIDAVLDKVQRAFPGKAIAIGEVGWPSAGRSRERAVTGRWMQAEFLSRFANYAAKKQLDYNVVEAFDQIWKSAHEGTMGANWGIFDAERREKFNDPSKQYFMPGIYEAIENKHWLGAFVGSMLLALILTVWSLRLRLATMHGVGVALFAQILATCLTLSALHGYAAWYDKLWMTSPVTQVLLQALLAVAVFSETLRRLSEPAAPVPLRSPTAALGRWGSSSWRDRLLAIFVLLALYETVWLAVRPDLPEFRAPLESWNGYAKYVLFSLFNGRYRDFPIPEFLVPVIGTLAMFLLLAVFGRRPMLVRGKSKTPDRVIALPFALGIPTMLWTERFVNREAMVWAAMALIMAVCASAGLVARQRTT
jgi:exo-beta-1,3-glucanase (GH17 family)